MDPGVESAVYLSLLGGNADDSGDQGEDANTWWANLNETEEEKQLRSKTGFLLRRLPATPSNLVRIEDANTKDLAWMVDTKLASLVDSKCSMPARNSVTMAITVIIDGIEYTKAYTRQWGQAA